MVEISDRLRCLFNATLERRGDSYVLEIPRKELDQGEVTSGETYRVAVLSQTDSKSGIAADETQQQRSPPLKGAERTPPVEEGEVREVKIESVGDQGDGIAKVEHGYVVIVPGARPGDEPTIEIENVRENVAFAAVVDGSTTASVSDSTGADTQSRLASQSSSSESDGTE